MPVRTFGLLAALICTVLWSESALALACSAAVTDIAFGNVDPTLNQNIDTTGTWTINCTGGTANDTVRACNHICDGSGGMDSSTSPRYMLNGSTQLQFNLYRLSSYTGVWGQRNTTANVPVCQVWSGGSVASGNPTTVTLDGSGAGSTSLTVYGRIFSGQTTLGSGTYTSTFGARIASSPSESLNCSQIGTTNVEDVSFTASATVVSTCRVTATDLDFGTQTLLSNDVDATSTVSVTCTSGLSYALSLNEGTGSGGTTTTRLMTHTISTETVPYQMYSDAARTQNWGNSATDDVEGTGTGSAVGHTVYGRIPAQATAPDAGSYIDTVTVTVTY